MKFPTGGKAREPKGMIRCNSEADSIVWMKEDAKAAYAVHLWCTVKLWNDIHFRAYYISQKRNDSEQPPEW